MPIVDGTIPFEVTGIFGAGTVLLQARRPTAPASSPAAACAPSSSSPASQNVLTKCLGSNNPHNMVRATIEALRELQRAASGRGAARQDRSAEIR